MNGLSYFNPNWSYGGYWVRLRVMDRQFEHDLTWLGKTKDYFVILYFLNFHHMHVILASSRVSRWYINFHNEPHFLWPHINQVDHHLTQNEIIRRKLGFYEIEKIALFKQFLILSIGISSIAWEENSFPSSSFFFFFSSITQEGDLLMSLKKGFGFHIFFSIFSSLRIGKITFPISLFFTISENPIFPSRNWFSNESMDSSTLHACCHAPGPSPSQLNP